MGFLALWPALFLVLLNRASEFMALFGERAPGWGALGLFAFGAVTLSVFPVSVVVYIAQVFGNRRLPIQVRAMWSALFFFAGPISMPVYFIIYERVPENRLPNTPL